MTPLTAVPPRCGTPPDRQTCGIYQDTYTNVLPRPGQPAGDRVSGCTAPTARWAATAAILNAATRELVPINPADEKITPTTYPPVPLWPRPPMAAGSLWTESNDENERWGLSGLIAPNDFAAVAPTIRRWRCGQGEAVNGNRVLTANPGPGAWRRTTSAASQQSWPARAVVFAPRGKHCSLPGFATLNRGPTLTTPQCPAPTRGGRNGVRVNPAGVSISPSVGRVPPPRRDLPPPPTTALPSPLGEGGPAGAG